METKLNGKVTLVGAGPGNPELITLKGIRALREADVVLYDALVNEELLRFAPEAVKVFVGKRRNKTEFAQEKINALILDYVGRYPNVVRLKGGDSFVFGRGYEELQVARQHGFETEVIPGVSSAIAVPGNAGIPVTHRGLSRSFHVITATQHDGTLNEELTEAVQSKGTVLILMGLHLLKTISELYKAVGKGNLPAAIVLDGTLSTEEQFVGTIATLPTLFKNPDAKPGIIIIGEVVKLKADAKTVNYELALEQLKNTPTN